MKRPKNLMAHHVELWNATTRLQRHAIRWYLRWRHNKDRIQIKHRFRHRLSMLRQAKVNIS